jgi:hypothetical protein
MTARLPISRLGGYSYTLTPPALLPHSPSPTALLDSSSFNLSALPPKIVIDVVNAYG